MHAARSVAEIPLTFGISNQSDTACLAALPLTVPARVDGAAVQQQFLCSVYFSGTGWDMIAKCPPLFLSLLSSGYLCSAQVIRPLRFPLR